MHFYNNMNKYIYIHIFLIILYLTKGKCNFLNSHSHDYGVQRSADENKLVKAEDSTANVNTGLVDDRGVRAAGEVFVPKTFPMSSQEPSCEQLRAMWIFSKRQSRAAEITNEIPTYRDPFTYNVWEPIYPSSRLLGSIRMGVRERTRSPVFGRIISREPVIPQRISFEHQNGASHARLYGGEVRPSGIGVGSGTGFGAGAGPGIGPAGSTPHRASKNRYVGVSSNLVANAAGSHNSVAVHGSFQKLKELIWTERAKELTQQRRAEELAARAAVLKEIANGQNFQSSYKIPFNNQGDSLLMDENRSPDTSGNRYLNDERVSIANVQNLDTVNKNVGHSNSGSRASTRRIGSAYKFVPNGQTRKESHFTGNVAAGQQNTYSRLRTPATEINAGDSKEKDQILNIGIPRTYPVRQSHFRERNRSLFKQYSPNEYFRRNSRILNSLQFGPQAEPQELRQDFNENYLSPLTSIEYYTKPRANGLLFFNNDNLVNNVGLTRKSNAY